jgi:hypothetical protein
VNDYLGRSGAGTGICGVGRVHGQAGQGASVGRVAAQRHRGVGAPPDMAKGGTSEGTPLVTRW